MRTTIDKAGRMIIPKALRDALGLVPGPVEVVRDGTGLRIVPVAGEGLVEKDGRLIIDEMVHVDDAMLRARRLEDQR